MAKKTCLSFMEPTSRYEKVSDASDPNAHCDQYQNTGQLLDPLQVADEDTMAACRLFLPSCHCLFSQTSLIIVLATFKGQACEGGQTPGYVFEHICRVTIVIMISALFLTEGQLLNVLS
ncbi:hypothetical protein P7K49_001478 [Saguinus oedipus]|uniref:Uncharacterized protein n=1 Tax=Saguinus oedipus TaxID=9490 RepID=A0ABQ9WEL4_SAGOE|nr:hypothetical protein P7K49_001478 [Saguinus oedipus]